MATSLTLEDGATALTLEDGATPLTLEDSGGELGFAVETDSALAATAAKSLTVGQAVETDEAIGRFIGVVVGQAVETDSALTLDTLTLGHSIQLSSLPFNLTPIAPVILAAAADWLVRIVRPPAMTVTEEITPDMDPEVPRTFGEFHEEQANELGRHGFSTFEIDAFDIQPGDLVEYYDRGLLIGGGVIRAKQTEKVSRQSEGKVPIRWTGVRPLGVLEEAPIFPSRGIGSLALDRIWGWFGISYDDSSWIPATEIVQGNASHWADDAAGPGFEDDTAWWVWASRRSGDPSLLEWAPDGLCLFRQTGTVPTGYSTVVVQWLGDAVAEMYFEGESLGSSFYKQDETSAPISVLSGQEVLVAVACTNDVDPEGDQIHNPGGAKWVVWGVNPTTGERDTIIMHSDSTAVMLEYVTARPGVTPGEVLLEVLAEVQAQGFVTWVVPTFGRDVDSAGRPWAEVGEIGTKVGYDLWKLTQQLISVYIDSDLTPGTNEWHAWSKDTRGRATAVVYQATSDPQTSNLPEHVVTETLMRGNYILSNSKFGWQEHTNWVSGRKIAATLGLGALPSLQEVNRWGTAELNEDDANRIEHDVQILPVGDSDKPYWSYGIGDTVTIDGVAEICQSISWRRDENGVLWWDEDEAVDE